MIDPADWLQTLNDRRIVLGRKQLLGLRLRFRGRQGPFVNVDATYRDGLAGIAYTGVTGADGAVISAASSIEAELRALRWAMGIADEEGVERVLFRTDCHAAARPDLGHLDKPPGVKRDILALLARHPRWRLAQIPRASNQNAHLLAAKAYRRNVIGRRAA